VSTEQVTPERLLPVTGNSGSQPHGGKVQDRPTDEDSRKAVLRSRWLSRIGLQACGLDAGDGAGFVIV
jgi:hypothetical protein